MWPTSMPRARSSGPAPVGRHLAGPREPDVVELRHPAVAAQVDVQAMEVGLVAAGEQVGASFERAVGEQPHVLGQPDRSGEADRRTGRAPHGLLAGQPHDQAVERVDEFDLVDVEIAAHHHRDDLLAIGPDGLVEHGLGHRARRQGEERFELLDRAHVRCRMLLERLRRAAVRSLGRDRFGLLDVRGVARSLAVRGSRPRRCRR